MDTEFRHWVEWKAKCDLRLCGQETQVALLQYLRKRAGKLVQKACHYTGRVPTGLSEMDEWRWWDLFEGFYVDRASRTQKCYKDWLFHRGEQAYNAPAEALERKVCFLLEKDVLRKFVRECCPRMREEMSLDEPLGRDNPDGETRKDQWTLLGDETRNTIARHETEQIATNYADWLFGEMNQRERVAVAATYLNLAHSSPEVEHAAGCKKSVLRTAYRGLFSKLVERLKSDYPEESTETLITVGFSVFETLKVNSYAWARHETRCKGFMNLERARTTSGDER